MAPGPGGSVFVGGASTRTRGARAPVLKLTNAGVPDSSFSGDGYAEGTSTGASRLAGLDDGRVVYATTSAWAG